MCIYVLIYLCVSLSLQYKTVFVCECVHIVSMYVAGCVYEYDVFGIFVDIILCVLYALINLYVCVFLCVYLLGIGFPVSSVSLRKAQPQLRSPLSPVD